MKKRDKVLSFPSNQQIEYLEKLFEKKLMEFEGMLEKKMGKVKDVVDSINQLDRKISNIENMMGTSSAINAHKVLHWISNLPK